jgi:uncharacterized protein (TIGR03086 family)
VELLDALEMAFDHTTAILAGVRPDQLDQPTPCRDWDLRAVIGHMTAIVVNCGLGAAGDDRLPRVLTVPLEPDVAAQFRAAADRTLTAWRAVDLATGEVNIGRAPRPARVALGINLLDTSTHSWDVARATGQDPTLPAGLAETVLAVGRGFVDDDLRRSAGFDPALDAPDGTGPTGALVAFLGRRP